MIRIKLSDIRKHFIWLYQSGQIADNGTIEIVNASFIADEDTIFGTLDEDYAERELRWYLSASRNINDMQEPVPQIWKDIADKFGIINSNYGWCIYSIDNGEQMCNALNHLRLDKTSRQAVMIYNRPEMHKHAFANGRRDFMCTYSTQLLIRNNKLDYIVNMRSNDAVFGYKNDYQWHQYVWMRCVQQLKETYPTLKKGDMHWNAGSLHVYPRHFKLIEERIQNDKS